jgi:hypothetical protein
MHGESAQDSNLSVKEEVVLVMKLVLDRFLQEATTRFTRLNDMNSNFGFLLDTQTILKSEDLNFQHVLHQKCLVFKTFKPLMLTGKLCTEIYNCKMLLHVNRDNNEKPLSPLDIFFFYCVIW